MGHFCQYTALDTIPTVKMSKIKVSALETCDLCYFLSWGGRGEGEREQRWWWVDTKHSVVGGMSRGVSIRVRRGLSDFSIGRSRGWGLSRKN